MIDPRDVRIAELEAQVAALLAENAALRKRLEQIEEKLGLNSSNSSMPPSTDRGKNPNRTAGTKAGGGRTPGGQKGHRGTSRALLPPEQVDAIVDHVPGSCARCGRRAATNALVDPTRHQVLDVPRIKPSVIEHRCWAYACRCGTTTRATLPADVPRGICGARLLATIALLTGVFRLSRRNAQRALSVLFGVDIALGTLSEAEQIVSESVQVADARARAYVQKQPVLHMDETSWRERRGGAWLWVAATSLVTVFMIAAGRGTETAKRLIGRFSGTLVTDRLATYDFWAISHRQVCWAHLIRTFRSLAETTEGCIAHRIGTALVVQSEKLFAAWHRVRDGTLTRAQFETAMRPMRREILALLREGASCGVTKVMSRCKGIYKHRRALFSFARLDGVEPTNNCAERALRHGVILRKTSFGTHSAGGSRFLERMLTVTETLRQQHRDVLEFLVDAVHAHFTQARSPSLLPS